MGDASTPETLTAMTTTATRTDRALATIAAVTDITAIPDADRIVAARIRGWDIVTRKGEFTDGDLAVYFEIDSHLPATDTRYDFLAARGQRSAPDGYTGHVLRTARLRGRYSQGLALPVSLFPELGNVTDARVGEDVTDILGIRKWEPPIPASLAGEVAGPFPSWIAKTDETRIQNVADILAAPGPWTATEKLDGMSATYFVDDDTFGVCGRNYNYRHNPDNSLWAVAERDRIETLLRDHAADTGIARVAIQGELWGPGIQKNPLRGHDLAWSAYNLIHDGHRVPRSEWPDWLLARSVPVRDDLTFPDTVDTALDDVNGLRSVINPDRAAEGVVWRHDTDTHVTSDGLTFEGSFKVISNKYLLKHDI